MVLHKYNKVRAKRPAKNNFFIHYSLFFSLALTALSACQSDWRNGITRAEQPADISFTGSVVSSQMATRADGSIINLHEYQLPETKERSYWRYDADTKTVKEKTSIYYAGLFGCYTKKFLWKDLIKAYQDELKDYTDANAGKTEADFLASDKFADFKKTELGQAYSANLFYNQKMNIGKYTDGKEQMLTYDPIKFWPNNTFGGDNTHEYCTFWAYYPYNESGTQGTYGISVSPESMGTGRGLGAVKFTMHPDAAEQNDFLISEVYHDANRDLFPLQPVVGASGNTYEPKPVPLRFHHMLAQVRIYAFIIGTDKLVYYDDDQYYAKGDKYLDAWGVTQTVSAEDDGKIKKINEAASRRWLRESEVGSLSGNRYRSKCTYKLEFNNLRTTCNFTPVYDAEGNAYISVDEAGTLGSTTVNHYIMNPYWFTFDKTSKERIRLNDNYMYGYFEDTPAYLKQDATDTDGINWSSYEQDKLAYLTQFTTQAKELQPATAEGETEDTGHHYNYAPGNIIMAVPQELKDDDVPNIVITATGEELQNLTWDPALNGGAGGWSYTTKPVTAKVTINMLKLGLKWESGYIYCYAFLDELSPGDDKVKGPESITTIFDPKQWTDQW